jgi:polyketide cyclase/dehydrase/lipid transport protein
MQPVTGTVDLAADADSVWAAFANVPRWSLWNQSFWRSWVVGGELRPGATIWLLFNPIKPWLLYKLPGPATIVELEERSVTWKVDIAGLHARHRYSVTPLPGGGCRFESWEVAEGPLFDATRPFWLAHFRFVRDASLDGARYLG